MAVPPEALQQSIAGRYRMIGTNLRFPDLHERLGAGVDESQCRLQFG